MKNTTPYSTTHYFVFFRWILVYAIYLVIHTQEIIGCTFATSPATSIFNYYSYFMARLYKKHLNRTGPDMLFALFASV